MALKFGTFWSFLGSFWDPLKTPLFGGFWGFLGKTLKNLVFEVFGGILGIRVWLVSR